MMQVAFQNNPRDFLNKCGGYLAENEAEHNLILSLCQGAERRLAKGEAVDIRCCTLFDDGDLVLAAVQTPPHNLILSKASHPDIEKLAETLANNNFKFPGIVGPSDVASLFANKWAELTGQNPVEYMDQIIYVLKKALLPPPIEGELRFAKPEEAELIAGWIYDFVQESLAKVEKVSREDAQRMAKEMIGKNGVAVWSVRGKPVSQAAVSGTDSVARINMVYTPPEHRGRGYASATVAHLSQMQLDLGKKMCCLSTNARNPVSNSIYRKIGYEFAGRSSLYVLDKI